MLKRVAIGIVVLAVLAGGSVALGAIPGADGVIKGCYDNSGNLKVIDSAATCNTGSTPISWNQKGPKGDGFVHRGVSRRRPHMWWATSSTTRRRATTPAGT